MFEQYDISKMPGHWFLARMGKKVLRPGGIGLTHKMIQALDIGKEDEVVELAPGTGATAALLFARQPASYIGVDQNTTIFQQLEQLTPNEQYRFMQGNATRVQRPDQSASVVVGEALLTMQTEKVKQQIICEAARLLKPGGRYAIHEIGLFPDDIPESRKQLIHKDLAAAIHVNARPLTTAEWKAMFHHAGFTIKHVFTAGMLLLEPGRLLADEGINGIAKMTWRILTSKGALKRTLTMRSTFRKHLKDMQAISIVAVKN